MGDTLVDINDKRTDLTFSQHGFKYHVGQVVALNSGEWLLNVGAQADYVKRAIVRSKLNANDEYQSSGSLIKCSSDLKVCNSWGEIELQFERAFEGLQLDDGRLLLFKAEKKRLFLVDSEGFILDQLSGKEFWFGANKSNNGSVYGLETNSKKVFSFSFINNSIILNESELDFTNVSGDADKILSPSQVHEHSGNYWLLGVTLSKQSIDDLAEIKNLIDLLPSLLSVEAKSGSVRKLPFSFRADAEVEKIDDSIYFSDFDKYEIKRFDLTYGSMSLVKSKSLQSAIERDRAKVANAKRSLYTALTLNGVAALLALIWLIMKSSPVKQNETRETATPSIPYLTEGDAVDRELAHIAKMFAKKKLSMREMALVAPFKKIGNDYVYYPKGIFGKGLLISDAETLIGLYKLNQSYQSKVMYFILAPMFGVTLGLITFTFSKSIGLTLFGISILVFLIALLVFPIWFYIKRNLLTKGLLQHDHRLSLTDIVEQMAKAVSNWQINLIIFLGVSFLLFLPCLVLFYPKDIKSVIALFLYSLPFSILFIVFGYYLKKAKSRLSTK